MSYAIDKARQAFGEYTAKIHHRQGHVGNIFNRHTQPMEWFGYEMEMERIETLDLLLSEQAGRLGL